ncbi:MAG: murein L,D-transpeptidase catalytic domain-containing protein [Prosthecobacter sp.]|uniref:murein L,D-transpeptidase catalytic domain-containing protein n=1 Tax=Prosthecobacter sp. TaxID=1965333 RepID=UPI0038FDCFEB
MPTKPKLKPSSGKFPTAPAEIALAYAEWEKRGKPCTWIFEVDYSINSKKPRFFVFNTKTRDLYKYKTAHGSGGKNGDPHDGVCRQVSNVSESGCSSVGIIVTAELYNSGKVGRALRLDGVSTTNDKIRARGVVLHGGQYVFDNDASTDKSLSGRSLGCIVTDERYIHPTDGGELLDILANGSIGVTHFGGKFKI